MLHYLTIQVTKFAQNCSILWCDVTNDGAVIDPGGDLEKILDQINAVGVNLKKILLTHTHIDHAGAVFELKRRRSDLEIVGPHIDDAYWIDQLEAQSDFFGFPKAYPFTPNRWLVDGDKITLGQSELVVRHCPGHTAGHVVFHSSEIDRVFVGDVLFVGSVGRTDLPTGNHRQLISSIKERLYPMGDQTVFIPGHGNEGTIGAERKSNRFLN
jgi:hydroxyacylglutathione hydrolase